MRSSPYSSENRISEFRKKESMSEADPAADTFRWRARLWHPTYVGSQQSCSCASCLRSPNRTRSWAYQLCTRRATPRRPTRIRTWRGCGSARRICTERGSCTSSAKGHHDPSSCGAPQIKWMQLVFTRYHAGHKLGATGKSTFVAPVAGPWQQLPPCFEWNDYVSE